MANNYEAWGFTLDGFDGLDSFQDRLKFFLNFAVLAPSSHNSQPWRFLIEDNHILVSLEPQRSLPDSDRNNRQAYISIGCALENIVIGADYCGYRTDIIFLAKADSANLIVKIGFSEVPNFTPPQDHLARFITKRVTNRNPYKQEELPGTILDLLRGMNTESTKIFVITDYDKKREVAEIAVRASVDAMRSSSFRKELAQYVTSNKTAAHIGMPGFGFGMPLPVSVLVPHLIKWFNMNKINAKKDLKLLKERTPTLVIIATSNDNPNSWMEVGRLYERVALTATKLGLATAMWASPIQIGEHYKELQQALGTGFRPQALFGLGKPIGFTPHSPRLGSGQVSGFLPC